MEKSEAAKMGTAPVFPLLVKMAVPPMISMLIASLYNIVDSIFVSKISMDALTAVSLAFPVQNLILSVAVGTGVGINSYIARKLGEKQQNLADEAVTHGILLAIFSAIVFFIMAVFFIKPFIAMFTDSPVIMELSYKYTSIVTMFSFGMLIHIAIEKILQSTGNMIFPMILQVFGAIVNIILDPILIFGYFSFPKLGITGAALATIIGQISAMAFAVIILVTKEHDVKPIVKGFRFDIKIVKEIYKVGFPSILMNSLSSILISLLNMILVGLSDVAVSVFGVYFKLQTFVYMPSNGLLQGLRPIVSYNYGARNRKRVFDVIKVSIIMTFVIMFLGMVLFNAFPKWFLMLFSASGEAEQIVNEQFIIIGEQALRIISWSFIFATFGFVFSGTFEALGRGFHSLTISLLRQIVIIFPLAFILSRYWGTTGVWIAFPIAEFTASVIGGFALWRLSKKDEVLKGK